MTSVIAARIHEVLHELPWKVEVRLMQIMLAASNQVD